MDKVVQIQPWHTPQLTLPVLSKMDFDFAHLMNKSNQTPCRENGKQVSLRMINN